MTDEHCHAPLLIKANDEDHPEFDRHAKARVISSKLAEEVLT